MMTIPLQVCKAMTAHKSQGMEVEDGCVWKKAAVSLPPTFQTPGIE
jgi:hypothetical protein